MERGARSRKTATAAAVLAGCLAMIMGCSVADRKPDMSKPPSGHGRYTGTVADWPLWFPRHYFGTDCFSVQKCRIDYGGHPHVYEKPQPTFESLGRPIEKVLRAGRGPILNFPPPAKIRWTTFNGDELEALVDMAEIFADRLVRHSVPRDQIKENAYIPFPGIVLVVDDRTVSVYMSTWIPLKLSENPESPTGKLHTGLELVHTRRY